MKPTPWYKNFWPWFLIFFPLVAIIGCISLLITAIGNGPDMVVDDYYKKGKAINLELSKFDKAKALYLHGDLKVEHDKVSFKFNKGDTSNIHSLKMSFYHRTIGEFDFDTHLTPNANGEFTAIIEPYNDGTYTVFIEPTDGSWKLKENITLPNEQSIAINPEYK
ncbi:FixH family protein [Pseudoalteromonas shioyasakiensis]|uniref:FixH family protein n=1 Tax=Pseudoalteromonas shioyasakiensis TaxID=1190813 RepID=UPI0021198A18|nr:FixH family protein [Pseudoalteromonas shioyasakiensis]MCQ8877042.1 FixH family protein [Pseudoalteromonas shioyasakiensis]